MPHQPRAGRPRTKPRIKPGYSFSVNEAWIDRLVLRKPKSELHVSKPRILRNWLNEVEEQNEGIKFSPYGDGFNLEISNKVWLFGGTIYFRRQMSGEKCFAVSANLDLNVMRYAAHTLYRQRSVRLPPSLKVRRINEEDGIRALQKLRRSKAKSLDGSDNYFASAGDFFRFGKRSVPTLRQYVKAVERELQRILEPPETVSFWFSLGEWTVRQIEVFWEFEELDALYKAQAIADSVWRNERVASKHSYLLTRHHAHKSGGRSVSISAPLIRNKSVRLVCYAKTSSRLRVEIKYLKAVRQVGGDNWKTTEYPNGRIDFLPDFVSAIVEDASNRTKKFFIHNFPNQNLPTGNPPALKVPEAVARVASALSYDHDLMSRVIRDLFIEGTFLIDKDENDAAFKRLVRAGILSRHTPRKINNIRQYVLTDAYRRAFDLARSALSGTDNQSN